MTFTNRITQARDTLTAGTDPDGLDVWQALLLAERAATVANYATDTDTAAGWDFYGLTLANAIGHLDAPLAAGWTLSSDVHPTRDDFDRLAEPVRGLIQRLADVLATAAEGAIGSPWRRLVWAQVAHRLDDVRKDLP